MEETEEFKKEVIRHGAFMSERERRIALWFWQLVEEARKEAGKHRDHRFASKWPFPYLPWECRERELPQNSWTHHDHEPPKYIGGVDGLNEVYRSKKQERPQPKPQPLPNPCKYTPRPSKPIPGTRNPW